MKLVFKGKYSGDETTLPQREHPENYKMFKEPDSKKFMLIANGFSLAITVVLIAIAIIACRSHLMADLKNGKFWLLLISLILPSLIIIPHELLHAICFKDTVFLYSYFQQGAMFVLGLEDMSKARFTYMSLLPNIIFGFIPFIAGIIFPQLYWLAIFGALAIGSGAGDYINVFNALTQVAKGGKIYMCGFHSYWYLPEN